MVIKVLKHITDSSVFGAAEMTTGFVAENFDVARGMHLLKNYEVAIEVINRVGEVVGLFCDLAFVGAETVAIDSICFEHFPVFGHVAARAKVGKECFADRNIVGCRVVVELLVPLLIEVACSLRNVMTVHDVQDLVSHSLAVARAFANQSKHLTQDVGS